MSRSLFRGFAAKGTLKLTRGGGQLMKPGCPFSLGLTKTETPTHERSEERECSVRTLVCAELSTTVQEISAE